MMSDSPPKGFSLSRWAIILLIPIGIPMRLKSLIGYIMPKKKFRLRENAHYEAKRNERLLCSFRPKYVFNNALNILP